MFEIMLAAGTADPLLVTYVSVRPGAGDITVNTRDVTGGAPTPMSCTAPGLSATVDAAWAGVGWSVVRLDIPFALTVSTPTSVWRMALRRQNNPLHETTRWAVSNASGRFLGVAVLAGFEDTKAAEQSFPLAIVGVLIGACGSFLSALGLNLQASSAA